MLDLKKKLGQGLLLVNMIFVVSACTRAFGGETHYESKSQPAERLGNLALFRSTTTFEWSDLSCTKEPQVYICKTALEPVKNIFLEKDESAAIGGLQAPQIDGVLFDYVRTSNSLNLRLSYASRPDLNENDLHALAKETFEKSSTVLKTRTFMLMVYE